VPGTKRPSSEESELELLGLGDASRAAVEASVGIMEAGERAGSGAPHSPQNRLVPGFSAEHWPHFAMDGFTLPLCLAWP